MAELAPLAPAFTEVEQNPGFSMMENIRNSRLGRFVTAGMASMALFGSAEAGNLALNASPVAANSPTPNQPEAQASYLPTVPCKSTDETDMWSHWRVKSSFTAPDGKEPIDSVRPGGIARFVARAAGGNLEAFNLDVYIHELPKDMEVLKRDSHPAWSKAGGDPHWAIKGLCHWKDVRTISFLVKIDEQAKAGKRLCVPYGVDGRTGYKDQPNSSDVSGTMHNCIKVK